MSLLPHYQFRPTRLLNQHFGQGLHPEDLLSPSDVHHYFHSLNSANYYRPWKSACAEGDAGSTLDFDKIKFHVILDVQQFAPDEITVKVTGENMVTVEGKHEEKEDDHGLIFRQFTRRYIVPKGYNMNLVVSRLSTDGVLSITVPKLEKGELEHRHVPIMHTGQPSRLVTSKNKEVVKNAENK